MLIGLLLSLLVAVLDSSVDIYFSRRNIKTLPHLVKVFSYSAVGVPMYGFLLFFTGIPEVPPLFWFFVCIQSALVCLALWFYMSALADGSVAQTKPILGLTPMLMILTNPWMTNDNVSLLGWLGVFLISLGVCGTQLPEEQTAKSFLGRLLSPFLEIAKHKGSRFALLTATVFAFTANIDKICLQMSTPIFYLFAVSASMNIMVYTAMRYLYRQNSLLTQLPRLLKPAIGGGVLHCVMVLVQMHALLIIPVPYVVSLKRLSVLFSSLWAFFVRQDRKPSSGRLIGTVMVVLGIALIALAGI